MSCLFNFLLFVYRNWWILWQFNKFSEILKMKKPGSGKKSQSFPVPIGKEPFRTSFKNFSQYQYYHKLMM